MATKLKVHTTEKVVRKVVVERRQSRQPTLGKIETTTAEFEFRLEVYLDLDKLIGHYAASAINNALHRFVRGPIEVRAVDIKEVPDTRTTDIK